MKLLRCVLYLWNYLIHYSQPPKTPLMKNEPIILTTDSVDLLVANIAEELLKGHNTYKSETAALKKKIKVGMLRTFSYQASLQKQQQRVA